MKHDADTNLAVLMIDTQIKRSGRMMASIANYNALKFLGCAKSFAQAERITRIERPDLVVVDAAQCAGPEFAAFSENMHRMQARLLVLTDGKNKPSSLARSATIVARDRLDASGGIGAYLVKNFTSQHPRARRPDADPTRQNHPLRIVVIGASTGGVEALLEVLSAYPQDCPPTLIVQHIGGEFLDGLAMRLDRNCRARVQPAVHSARVEPGLVLMAPGNQAHLTLAPDARRCRLVKHGLISGHRPSVDALFHSAAEAHGRNTIGVLLTGMGRDGANGLHAIRRAGGWTIAQDQASSTVFGMPRAAHEIGAVEEMLPLDEIGPAILRAAALKPKEPVDVAT
ncbi:Chemotaxis response regulator protein-glutamate methylesterase CheB [Candidatus Rhodobacter oscarellae]|uniref:protein-glutamate methylesterase n=1 Tax=Candidatus Rhodobacter oscarellae TaxID=1675527 RepID=A0A0J9ED87_9RHOB|nr:CheB methylesterase domain-containing protein [Candidatus Rhodobacter lobularis]KMW60670.1 Chemotaxis response regulator protein-glutamate methylesterase CheB [Candidatus Rhodobacter lobularis]